MEFFVSNNLPQKKEVEISVGLSVFGKTAIRKLPGSKGDKVMGEWRTKGDKVMGEWRTIHKDKFRDSCFTSDTETITKIKDD